MLTRDITGWTEDEVLAVFAAAKASITAGSAVVSWGSSGSSVTRQIHDSPAAVCNWCQWMLRELNPEVYGFQTNRTVASFRTSAGR
jgi:hypothetical protein